MISENCDSEYPEQAGSPGSGNSAEPSGAELADWYKFVDGVLCRPAPVTARSWHGIWISVSDALTCACIILKARRIAEAHSAVLTVSWVRTTVACR